ncbi:hypothetical protein MATL_G00145810 [Megalops atlanticus]|uniref:NEDD4-binding protein 1 n=1 Tax=Megalops atlanticus TaxID=7932 RepID=A0A9D3PV52_MEGAT|nr:hypothetical protein MATL_G00145810 [Megalops atlanticus]
MSTTRPLLGMKRIPELACAEPPGSRHPAAAGQPQHDALTVDEFTVPEDKQEELKCVKPRVEQVFQVAFTIIGLLDPTAAHGSKASRQIWLKLKGKRGDVSKAKEYVKGLCAPELQQLLRDTSAEVAVLEPGRLRLLGGAEAVVMAQSRVQQFVALFQQNRSLPGDSEPAVKRAFKTFVEERADKYAMELLLLPSALKEELLNLARNAAAPPANGPPPAAPPPGPEQDRSQTSTPVTDLSNRILDTSFEDKAAGASRRRRDPEEECCCISSDSRQRPPAGEEVVVLDGELSDDADGVSPETNFKCLVNFFRTMGYQQDVVERVVRGAGQRDDTFLLLERIVEESQRAQRAQELRSPSPSCQPPTAAASSSSSSSSRAREYPEVKAKENVQPSSNGVVQSSGVQQRAALRGGVQSVQEVITIADDSEDAAAGGRGQAGGRGSFSAVAKMDYLSRGSSRGGAERVETLTPLRSTAQRPPLAAERPGCSYQTVSPRVPSVTPPPKAAPLTGVSRFQQSLRTPYRLTLQNEPGDPGLRHIIIDGSNVAMMHGLHRFFSCRGIAIAVETFWKRGHREITVFVPQWRQKRDPNITEQHFLTQLEDLRLLSFTPSREVCGQRISSHDDRFLLHLAEKTGGVIVTNDNMREFVDTSEAWRQIIKERLLQFTFVEDHFLIPDDPLGKHGPQLDEFLHKDFRCTPVPTPARSELRATPPVYVQALQSAPRPSLAPQTRPPSRWPHTGPPGWHPPRPSPSPPPQRSPAETEDLKKKLYDIFPDQKPRIDRILSDNPYMRDLNALSGLLLG